jgi:hypothetical protein
MLPFRADGDNSAAASGMTPSASNVLETLYSFIWLAVLPNTSARPARPHGDTTATAASTLHLLILPLTLSN